MEKIKLSAEPRKILGKKVKNLRKEGIVPANIFGKGLKSKSIQLSAKEFNVLFKKTGETGIVEVKIKDQTYSVLIHNVQKDPISDKIVHVDFHKVNLKEKIIANVPVKMIGESPAEKSGLGLILQTTNEIEIESLPSDIPHDIEVDISALSEIGQTIQVKDLKIDKEKVNVKNDLEEVIISVQSPEMKEVTEEETPTPEEVEATAEKGEEEEESESKPSKDETGEKKEQKQAEDGEGKEKNVGQGKPEEKPQEKGG